MSREKISYNQKLQLLRDKPYNQGIFSLLLKYQLKPYFFSLFTTMLVLIVVSMSFLANISTSKILIQQNSNLLSLGLKSLLELSGTDRDGVYNSIKSTLVDSLKPISGFTNTDALVEANFQKIQILTSDWLEAFTPLQQYSFSETGFTHTLETNKVFTNDLEIFFDKLSVLKTETEKIWGEMWYYKILINISNNDKAKEYISLIDTLINSISGIAQLKTIILQILGHYSTQKMVIFNQNIGEARPTGGFTGSFIPLDISQGKINIGESQSIYYIGGSTKNGIITHPSTWYYGNFINENLSYGGIQNLNFFNCFPYTAQTLQKEFLQSTNGYTIDQLILINPQSIQNILPDEFSLSVQDVGNINKQNFLDEIERISSFQAPDKSNPKSLIGPVFKALISKIPSIIKSVGSLNLGYKVLQSFDARDINIWFRNPEIQNLSARLGFASEQVCEDKNNKYKISPLVANISGDKRGLITKNSYSISTKKVWGGTRFTVNYIQNIPLTKDLQRNFDDTFTINMFGMQIPDNSFDISVKGDQVLNIPYLRTNFLENAKNEIGQPYIIPDTVKTLINTGSDLAGGGFTYNQPDGSLVAGAYVSDNNTGDTKVVFEFTLPVEWGERVNFYGQPGMNKPSLFLGEGLEIYRKPEIIEVTDPLIIQSGITLITK